MAKKATTKKPTKKAAQHIPGYLKLVTLLIILGSGYAAVRFGSENMVLAFIAAFVFGAGLLVMRNIIKAELAIKAKPQVRKAGKIRKTKKK